MIGYFPLNFRKVIRNVFFETQGCEYLTILSASLTVKSLTMGLEKSVNINLTYFSDTGSQSKIQGGIMYEIFQYDSVPAWLGIAKVPLISVNIMVGKSNIFRIFSEIKCTENITHRVTDLAWKQAAKPTFPGPAWSLLIHMCAFA